ncbi:unnamed protein product [Caenorhabditis nigoni]
MDMLQFPEEAETGKWNRDGPSHGPDCSLKSVQSPPTATSEVYLDFSTVDFPRNITHRSFTIVSENCAATIKMVSPDC